jgi:hypothetical protein
MTSAILAIAALAIPVGASASVRQYVLKHPKREHCKAHYVKRVERVKVREHGKLVKVKETFCVSQAPKPAPVPMPTPALMPTITSISAFTSVSPPFHFTVSGTVVVVGGTDLIGVPITYAITNQSTGQTLGSFVQPSDAPQPCTIVPTMQGNTQTFTGESVPPYAGCPFAPVSMPTGQIAVLVGSYAGSSIYAPSVGQSGVISL